MRKPWRASPSRPDLAGTVDTILEGSQLFDADRAAGMHLAGGNADFRAHAEFAAIGELGRGIVQQNGRINFSEEALDNPGVFGNHRLGVAG